MKKIAVWKVVLLSIVTFGIYMLVWLVRRRAEMVSKYGQKVPHWLWLIVPAIVVTALIVPFAIVMLLASGTTPDESTALVILALLALVALVSLPAYIITLWWVWQFGKAAGNVVNGKTNAIWTLLHYVFLGGVMIYVLQFLFNRAHDPKALKDQPREKPSTRFVVLSVIFIALSFAGGTAASFMPPTDFENKLFNQVDGIEEKAKKAEELLTKYEACTEQLEVDFPEVTEENSAAYDAAYDACDEIRIEQVKAATEYHELIQN